jgi:hypothetical protein
MAAMLFHVTVYGVSWLYPALSDLGRNPYDIADVFGKHVLPLLLLDGILSVPCCTCASICRSLSPETIGSDRMKDNPYANNGTDTGADSSSLTEKRKGVLYHSDAAAEQKAPVFSKRLLTFLRSRYLFLIVLVLVAGSLIFSQTASLQLTSRVRAVVGSEAGTSRQLTVFAPRGIITDRFGTPLAYNTETRVYFIWLTPTSSLTNEQQTGGPDRISAGARHCV